MKRILKISALVLIALIVIVTSTILITLKVNAVHQFVISRVNAEIPGTLSLGRLRVLILDTRVEMFDLALDDSSGNRLADLEKLTVDISSTALLKRKLYIEEVHLEDPEVVLDLDPAGKLSLLGALGISQADTQKTETGQADTAEPFPVELRGFILENGNVLFTSKGDSLEVRAAGLSAKASGNLTARSADLKFQIDSASVTRSGERLPVTGFSLVARMNQMNLDTVAIELYAGSSKVILKGSADSLSGDPLLNVSAVADLALSEISLIAGIKEQLSGNAVLDLNANGRVTNPNLDLDLTYGGGTLGGYPIDTLFVQALLDNRILRLNPLFVTADMGRLTTTGSVDMQQFFSAGLLSPPASTRDLKYDLDIQGNSIPLKGLAPGLAGTARIFLSLDGQGVIPDSIQAQFRASADIASFRLNSSPAPMDVSLACSAAVDRGTALVHYLTGSLGETLLSLEGRYGIASSEVNAHMTLSAPDLANTLALAGVKNISGKAEVTARVDGNISDPRAGINLVADAIQYDSTRVGDIVLAADLYDGVATVRELTLNNRSSTLKASGRARILDNGTPVPVGQMTFDISLFSRKLLLGDFLNSIEGRVALDAEIRGVIDDPGGHVRLSVSDLMAAGQSISNIDLDARLSERRVSIVSSSVAVAPDEQIDISGWASLTDSFNLALVSPGISLTSIDAINAAGPLKGLLSLSLNAAGTYSNPIANGSLAIRKLEYEKRPLDDITLNMAFEDQQIDIDGELGGNLDASYNLGTRAFDADLAFENFLLTPFLALSGQPLEGGMTAALKASGNSDSLLDVNAVLDVEQLSIAYSNQPVIEARLNATLKNGAYSAPDISIVLADEGFLTGHAEGNLKGVHDIALNGDVPLSIAQRFTPDLDDIEGNIRLNGVFKRTPLESDLSAQVLLNDIGVTLPGLAQRLHSLNGRIVADQNKVQVAAVRGNLDDGVFNLNAGMELADFAPSDLEAEITLEALPVNVPDMLDLTVDARLQIGGTPDTARVAGDVTILDGLYYQNIDINPLAGIGERTRRVPAPPTEIDLPYLKSMLFDVSVNAQTPFRVDNNLAKLTITPDLMLMGTLETPSLSGRATVDEGTLAYAGREFDIERGVVDFVDPYSIEPEVDILGTVTVQKRIIQILASGGLNDLQFELSSSDPTLADQDILSLLVLGKTTAELQGESQTEESGQTNQQIIASLIASTFGEEIRSATGLDTFTIETGSDDDENSDRIALTLGKNITNRLNTIYTVESEEGEIIQRATAEYRLLNNLSITGFRNTRGIFGGELRLIWELR